MATQGSKFGGLGRCVWRCLAGWLVDVGPSKSIPHFSRLVGGFAFVSPEGGLCASAFRPLSLYHPLLPFPEITEEERSGATFRDWQLYNTTFQALFTIDNAFIEGLVLWLVE